MENKLNEINTLKDSILEFLEDELAIDISQIDEKSLIFSTGLIDSFSLISLISFLENKLSFRMSPADISLDNLDSIEKIISYVSQIPDS